MYSPDFYKMSNQVLIEQLIGNYPLATLLTEGSSQSVSHLPAWLVKNHNGDLELLSHFARANPHWKELRAHGKAKLMFHGPSGYISPAWYPPAKDNVPTYNYAVVHVVGDFHIVESDDDAFREMDKFVSHFEEKYKTGWALPKGEPEVMNLMRGIVVFKVSNLKIEAKFKLSQRQEKTTRDQVISVLSDYNSTLSELMRSV